MAEEASAGSVCLPLSPSLFLCSFHGRGGICRLSMLALISKPFLKDSCSAYCLPVQKILTVLVHRQLDNDNLAGVDANIDGGTVGLLPLDTLNVNPELCSVALQDLANLLTLEVSTGNLNLIILTDGHGADAILCFQLLAERGRHHLTTNVRRSVKVTLARLASA